MNASGGASTDKLYNLAWWDGVSYDAVVDWTPTLGSWDREVDHGLARIRGAIAKTTKESKASGDTATWARAWKLVFVFDRMILSQPLKKRGGQKKHRPKDVRHNHGKMAFGMARGLGRIMARGAVGHQTGPPRSS